ncbi:MAG: hypothetical protein ACQESG_03885 [Nanobdellota archaeon]
MTQIDQEKLEQAIRESTSPSAEIIRRKYLELHQQDGTLSEEQVADIAQVLTDSNLDNFMRQRKFFPVIVNLNEDTKERLRNLVSDPRRFKEELLALKNEKTPAQWFENTEFIDLIKQSLGLDTPAQPPRHNQTNQANQEDQIEEQAEEQAEKTFEEIKAEDERRAEQEGQFEKQFLDNLNQLISPPQGPSDAAVNKPLDGHLLRKISQDDKRNVRTLIFLFEEGRGLLESYKAGQPIDDPATDKYVYGYYDGAENTVPVPLNTRKLRKLHWERTGSHRVQIVAASYNLQSRIQDTSELRWLSVESPEAKAIDEFYKPEKIGVRAYEYYLPNEEAEVEFVTDEAQRCWVTILKDGSEIDRTNFIAVSERKIRFPIKSQAEQSLTLEFNLRSRQEDNLITETKQIKVIDPSINASMVGQPFIGEDVRIRIECDADTTNWLKERAGQIDAVLFEQGREIARKTFSSERFDGKAIDISADKFSQPGRHQMNLAIYSNDTLLLNKATPIQLNAPVVSITKVNGEEIQEKVLTRTQSSNSITLQGNTNLQKYQVAVLIDDQDTQVQFSHSHNDLTLTLEIPAGSENATIDLYHQGVLVTQDRLRIEEPPEPTQPVQPASDNPPGDTSAIQLPGGSQGSTNTGMSPVAGSPASEPAPATQTPQTPPGPQQPLDRQVTPHPEAIPQFTGQDHITTFPEPGPNLLPAYYQQMAPPKILFPVKEVEDNQRRALTFNGVEQEYGNSLLLPQNSANAHDVQLVQVFVIISRQGIGYAIGPASELTKYIYTNRFQCEIRGVILIIYHDGKVGIKVGREEHAINGPMALEEDMGQLWVRIGQTPVPMDKKYLKAAEKNLQALMHVQQEESRIQEDEAQMDISLASELQEAKNLGDFLVRLEQELQNTEHAQGIFTKQQALTTVKDKLKSFMDERVQVLKGRMDATARLEKEYLKLSEEELSELSSLHVENHFERTGNEKVTQEHNKVALKHKHKEKIKDFRTILKELKDTYKELKEQEFQLLDGLTELHNLFNKKMDLEKKISELNQEVSKLIKTENQIIGTMDKIESDEEKRRAALEELTRELPALHQMFLKSNESRAKYFIQKEANNLR